MPARRSCTSSLTSHGGSFRERRRTSRIAWSPSLQPAGTVDAARGKRMDKIKPRSDFSKTFNRVMSILAPVALVWALVKILNHLQ